MESNSTLPSLARSRVLRLSGLAALYFAQGVPIGLLTIAFPAWLASNGASAGAIGAMLAFVGLPWAFKLIAGPVMDRFSFPPMGRRRPWVLAAQAGLTLSLLAFLFVDNPLEQIPLLTALGFIVNCFAAVQDVATDGMAIDVLPETERGTANAMMAAGQVGGYAGFGALDGYLLQNFGLVPAVVASAIAVGLIFLFLALVREREGERLMPWTKGDPAPGAPAPASFVTNLVDLVRALLLPMSLLLITVEVLARAGYGMTVAVLPIVATQELGFSSAVYTAWFGAISAGSAFVGLFFGPVIDRFGAHRLLAIGLIGSALCYVIFGLAPMMWGYTPFVVGMLGVSQLFGQAFFVSMIALFMGVCARRISATQFAVYMSLANLARSAGALIFGFLSASIDVGSYFLVIGGFMFGAAILLQWFNPARHQRDLEALSKRTEALTE